jgi:predicted aspartyl protease
MPSYDDMHFNPPAPVARVTLRNPGTGALVSVVSLLIDSGADVTLLPRSAVEAIGLRASPGDDCELMGFDGNKALAPVVSLEMTFLGRIFRGRFLLMALRGIGSPRPKRPQPAKPVARRPEEALVGAGPVA